MITYNVKCPVEEYYVMKGLIGTVDIKSFAYLYSADWSDNILSITIMNIGGNVECYENTSFMTVFHSIIKKHEKVIENDLQSSD